MSNGNAFTSSRFLPTVLAALAFAMAGCDSGRSPPPQAQSVNVGFLDPSDNGRQRDDLARSRIWILNSHGVFLYHTLSGKLVEVTLPSWQWVDTPYSCPPDLAIGPGGEAVVTSNVVPVLWRIDPRTLAVSVHELALDADTDKDIGFTGLTYSAEQRAWFATSGTHASLWRIDPSLRKASKTGPYDRTREACSVTAARAAE